MTNEKRIELPDEIFKKAYALKSDGSVWHTSILGGRVQSRLETKLEGYK